MELGRTVSLGSYVAAAIESSFQAVADYTTFTGYTRLGEEGGWFGFRHNPNKTCYGIFFTGTIGRGVLLLRRDTDGSWHAIKLWGGYCIAVFSRLLAVLKGWWEHGSELCTDVECVRSIVFFRQWQRPERQKLAKRILSRIQCDKWTSIGYLRNVCRAVFKGLDRAGIHDDTSGFHKPHLHEAFLQRDNMVSVVARLFILTPSVKGVA